MGKDNRRPEEEEARAKQQRPSPSELQKKARDEPSKTGQGANIRQNTTNQGYQQNR